MSRENLMRAGVMGWPVNHSRSPLLHGYWLKKYGISGSYEHIPSEPEKFETDLRALAAGGWRGMNVTIPHKEAALKLADEVTDRARAIGAANTIVVKDDGRISADNTDAFGFIENLKDGAGDAWNPSNPALVLGAGGAARAVLYALLEANVPMIVLANRSKARAENLAAEFGPKIQVVDFEKAETTLSEAGLIVNTTSLGMKGQPPLELDFSQVRSDAVATDIVYTPLMTPFLNQAEAAGLTIVDGLGMLMHQARPGFAAWFGVEPEVDTGLREVMLAP